MFSQDITGGTVETLNYNSFYRHIRHITEFMVWKHRRIQDFPDGGVVNAKGWGRQPIIWLNFAKKLHENEENWTGGEL